MSREFKNQFTQRMNDIIREKSVIVAKNLRHTCVYPNDLMSAILIEGEGIGFRLLLAAEINVADLLDDLGDFNVENKIGEPRDTYHKSSMDILERSDNFASEMGHHHIGTEHVILSFLFYNGRNRINLAVKKELRKRGVSPEDYKASIDKYLESSYSPTQKMLGPKKTSSTKKLKRGEKNSIVDSFLKNINEEQFENKENFIGRKNEIDRIIRVLCRKKKNNVIVIGEPGVGKSSIIRGVIQKIISGNVPDKIKPCIGYSLDLGALVAGTKYRGQFEERMKSVIDFFKKDKGEDAILVIDEIHQIISAGSAEGALDASSMLKPHLADGSIQCIGTTTLVEYRKYIVKDGPLSRRFFPVFLDESSKEDTLKILSGIVKEYEDYHKVRVSQDILEHIVSVCSNFVKNRNFPDKAIDVLDESCSRKEMEVMESQELIDLTTSILDIKKQMKTLTVEHKFEECGELKKKREKIANTRRKLREKFKKEFEIDKEGKAPLSKEIVNLVVSDMTGIPLNTIDEEEQSRLVEMEKEINKQVIAQPEAISKVCSAIKRSRAGLKNPNRPIGVFLILGRTGTGKTLLAKKLAEYMFGDESKVIRVDMSEYMEKSSTSRLIGSPPGFIGYGDGSKIIDQIKVRPYSVILLDEFEKSHPDVQNIFLQVFDEGHLTESDGGKIDFTNTIIFMTSNIGASKIDKQKQMGFFVPEKLKEKGEIEVFLKEEVKKRFSSEFRNRIDDVIVFNSLEKEHVSYIFDIELDYMKERLGEKEINLVVSQRAKDFLVDEGFSKEFGARYLTRTMERYLMGDISDIILAGKANKGDTISVSKKNGELAFSVRKRKIVAV